MYRCTDHGVCLSDLNGSYASLEECENECEATKTPMDLVANFACYLGRDNIFNCHYCRS